MNNFYSERYKNVTTILLCIVDYKWFSVAIHEGSHPEERTTADSTGQSEWS